MAFDWRAGGFESEKEAAHMYWKAATLDPDKACAWFVNNGTWAGLVAIIHAGIIRAVAAKQSAIRETIGSEIEKAKGE